MKTALFALVGSLGVAAVFAAFAPAGRELFSRRFREPRKLRFLTAALGTWLITAAAAWYLVPPTQSWVEGSVMVLGGMLFVAALTFPTHRLNPETPATTRKILAIGAHPDDLELACGATLSKLVDAGHQVQTMVMSGGSEGGDSTIRRMEAARGSEYMGASEVSIHDFTDTNLAGHGHEMVAAIEQAMREFNPDVVITHSSNDYHQDHRAVHDATMRAARQHSSILCFESPSASHQFTPSVFVDIDGYVDVKVHAVAMHRNQKGKPYMTADRVRSLAAFRGAQVRTSFAEGFEPVRLLSSAAGVF